MYACPMADNSNPSVMIDLYFERTYLGARDCMATTVYSLDAQEVEVGNAEAQGWNLVSVERVI